VLKTALFNTLAAASFNAVGDYTKGVYADGSLQKIAIHAMVGGLLAEVSGGDFKTGALAAGANEALVGVLDNLVKGNDNLMTMSSQIVGVLAATTQKDVDASKLEKAAWIAKNALQYNRQLHKEDRELAEQLSARSNGKYTVEQIEAQLRLSSVNGTEITGATDIVASGSGQYDTGGNWIALGNGQYVQNFAPADREVIAYIKENTNAYSWSLTAQTGFNSVSDTPDWSKASGSTILRDRLTGYSIDENGRYRVPITIDGIAYAPRYFPCGSAECLASGANIDFADVGTLKWLRATDVKAVNDIGWLMGVAAIPAGGATAAILSNGSAAASAGYLKDDVVSSLAGCALSTSFEKYAVGRGMSEQIASKLSNGLGTAGVWDTIVEKAADVFNGSE
jgi:filamentous hemagglutinin